MSDYGPKAGAKWETRAIRGAAQAGGELARQTGGGRRRVNERAIPRVPAGVGMGPVGWWPAGGMPQRGARGVTRLYRVPPSHTQKNGKKIEKIPLEKNPEKKSRKIRGLKLRVLSRNGPPAKEGGR